MKSFMKKIITVLLAIAMIVSSLPLGVIAATSDGTDPKPKTDGGEVA